ncbi:EAL domain, c-di-GMP-specific phosphodiesterase class I (or its enzymatically inactive variant) [Nitrosospira sp. Nsp11]|uniref:EAL domain-containing protein n=1 Tax=Nitrosospira sp. Nsp11 TaxID=1855338 RepID=UPI000918495C|nr:EAL domain-containing protein [Nitrosospira sp. Nsp11]SHL22085.1 EAL domain, c-di-GMP-specific phosphodiesterase class I (or its enzymatically inactive variant) [Nitrosospira sp. Nsp11]
MEATNKHYEFEQIQAVTDHLLQRAEDGGVAGYFFNNELSSVFQPVFDAIRRRVVGHSAYIRSKPDRDAVLSPWGVFALASEDTLLVSLDRLCRTLHAINYFRVASGQGSLFVSVQPRLLESVKDDHGLAFENILNLIGIRTSRVVIEIPSEVNRDLRLLKHVIGNYRSRGYRVAANHSGANDESMTELGSLYPDIVRLNASTLLQHDGTDTLLDTAHRLGAAILVTGIETRQQVISAVRTGADLLQGRFLGEPARMLEVDEPDAAGNVHQPAEGRSTDAGINFS